MKNKFFGMGADILYDSQSTISDRYYDSRSSINSKPVEVIRPIVDVHFGGNYNPLKTEVYETVIQRVCEIEKV